MSDIPVTPPPPTLSARVPINPTVAKSIARPDAFAKAGSMGKASTKPAGVRFRALKYQRGPGRPRKHARDARAVIYY